jgi:predicted anti-sigma-YlaC factor YlaD
VPSHEVEQLSCQELVELVTAYLEGDLRPDEQALVELHLDDCEGCRIFLDQMRRTIELTGRLRVDDVPPAAADALLTAFRGL